MTAKSKPACSASGDVAHQLLRTGLLAHHRVADQRHRVPPCRSSARVTTVRSWSPSPWSTTCCHSSARQASAGEPVLVGRLEGEVHVLERERQRELRREVALERCAAAWLPATETRAGRRRARRRPSRSRGPTGARAPPTRPPLRPRTRATCCSRASVVCRSRPAPTQMVRWPSASKRGVTRAPGLVGPRREDRQLALLGRVLASRDRRVERA